MTVIFETCAAAATSPMVTRSKPRCTNSWVAMPEIDARVASFFRSRSGPLVMRVRLGDNLGP